MKKNVNDVRHELARTLRAREFVSDKSGVPVIELVGDSFVADREVVFGQLNKDWVDREIRWYYTESRNVNDIEEPIPEIWKQVADSEGWVNSNYGWCVFSEENHSQFLNVVHELRKNPDSRRAVMIYTRPEMWNVFDLNGRSDFCCTNAVQYLIRNGKVNAVVQMRSNDLIFGYKGDRYWQAHMLERVAKMLHLPAGDIVWHCGSAHVYERHFYLVDWFSETGKISVSQNEYEANSRFPYWWRK